MFFADEGSIPTESQFHPESYFAHSPDIADNEEELSDYHSFDEQIHAMNENIGGNVADNTSEVEIIEKNCKTKKHTSMPISVYILLVARVNCVRLFMLSEWSKHAMSYVRH